MIENEIMLDFARARRIGLEEAVFCAGKSVAQLTSILEAYDKAKQSCLLTRLSEQAYVDLEARFPGTLDYDAVTGTCYFNWQRHDAGTATVGVVTAGSSDVPVAREAVRTLSYFGVNTRQVFDVGVAGLWRLLERLDEIADLPVVIVAAGMDAALPSVLGGLYAGQIIAIPTSVGYGVAAGGQTALNAILASCASGIVTVNIDNGYGAACAAMRAVRPRGKR